MSVQFAPPPVKQTVEVLQKRPPAEIALTAVHLGHRTLCSGLTALLAFDARTGMIAHQRIVSGKINLWEFADVCAASLGELHVPAEAEVDIICRQFPADQVADATNAILDRLKVVPNDGSAYRVSFDQIGQQIGHQVRATSAYEEASGYLPASEAERRFYVEALLDQAVYWYHRRPGPGLKSPIQRNGNF